MNKKKLGKLLKGLRQNAFPDVGLRKVAKEIGIEYTHLYRIESGAYNPNDTNLMKILKGYQANKQEMLEVFNTARISKVHESIIKASLTSGR